MSSTKPVFLKQRDIPSSDSSQPTVLEMCLAAERSSGQGSIIGAQSIRGLWRIYPATQEARAELLIKGMRVRDVNVRLCDINPYILRDNTGEEKPSTKLWIDDIPISVADSEIEHALAKLGCELRSAIKAERARDSDHKLTRFLTGRRYVFISVPQSPLEKSVKVSLFTAKLYHKEQKMNRNPPVCSICLQSGHHRSTCDKPIVCKTCKQSGHKSGDPACSLSLADSLFRAPTVGQYLQNRESQGTETCHTSKEKTGKKDSRQKDVSKAPPGDRNNRGRPLSRQTTLGLVFGMEQPRSRSETPKRRRSREQESPRSASGKQAKLAEDVDEVPHPVTQTDEDINDALLDKWS